MVGLMTAVSAVAGANNLKQAYMKYLIFIIFSFLSLESHSGIYEYKCQIKQVNEVSKNGNTVPHTGMYKQLVGKYFSINRSTGEMEGLPFTSRSFPHIDVIDKGGNGDAYKSILKSRGPHVWVKYMRVEEYEKGKLKPFMGIDGNNIYSGICE
jgi:hypothetical protein